MKELFCLLFLFGYALADCPFMGSLNSSTCCSQNLFKNSPGFLFNSIALTVANIGPNEYVYFPSGQKVSNVGYFSQSFTVYKEFVIKVCTGPNTVMQMQVNTMSWTEYDVPAPINIFAKWHSQVMHLSKWNPGTAFYWKNTGIGGYIIKHAEYVTDTTDLLQWSNVVVLSGSKVVGTLYDVNQNDTMYLQNVTLFYSQPIAFDGAVLITPLNIMGNNPVTATGVSYASPRLGDQSFFFNVDPNTMFQPGSIIWWTVIGAPDGSVALDVRTVIGNVSVFNAPPDTGTVGMLAKPLTNLPVRLMGSVWTFYSYFTNAAVKFSAVSV